MNLGENLPKNTRLKKGRKDKMVAIEDNIRTEVMSIKPLPKFMKRLGQDGNMYGNLWALRLYDEKIETEVNVVISQDYN